MAGFSSPLPPLGMAMSATPPLPPTAIARVVFAPWVWRCAVVAQSRTIIFKMH